MAERRFTATGPQGSFPVRVLLGPPTKFPDADDFYCLVQIQGLGDARVRYIVGLDGIQALQLTFSFVRDMLSHLSTEGNIQLEWAENSDIGF
jgi:hypothetical protein